MSCTFGENPAGQQHFSRKTRNIWHFWHFWHNFAGISSTKSIGSGICHHFRRFRMDLFCRFRSRFLRKHMESPPKMPARLISLTRDPFTFVCCIKVTLFGAKSLAKTNCCRNLAIFSLTKSHGPHLRFGSARIMLGLLPQLLHPTSPYISRVNPPSPTNPSFFLVLPKGLL